jgi:glutamyl-tRNA reductase
MEYSLHLELLVVGLSHQTASLALREKLSVTDDQLAAEVRAIAQRGALSECVLISTCNRVEVVAAVSDVQAARQAILDYFTARAPSEEIAPCVYRKVGDSAVRHLFRVAAGLEAMAVGEPQILGQVKEALAVAQSEGLVGPLLSRCFNRSFAVAKRVRHETGIAQGRVSISSIACDLAQQIVGALNGRKVLLVGAGKMSLESARTLSGHGAELLVVNRTPERARELAELSGAKPLLLESLTDGLIAADVVISSTSDPGFVITRDLLERALAERRGRRLFIIDIAVPRDVDPEVAHFENVFLYNVDDLQNVSKTNQAERAREIPAAERIIEEAVGQLRTWRGSLQLTPTIVALQERFRNVVLAERDKALARLGSLSEKDRHTVEVMCDAIVNKLLHLPLSELKRGCGGSDQSDLLEAAQRLFHLAVRESEADDGMCDATDVVPAEPSENGPIAIPLTKVAVVGAAPSPARRDRHPRRAYKGRS